MCVSRHTIHCIPSVALRPLPSEGVRSHFHGGYKTRPTQCAGNERVGGNLRFLASSLDGTLRSAVLAVPLLRQVPFSSVEEQLHNFTTSLSNHASPLQRGQEPEIPCSQ